MLQNANKMGEEDEEEEEEEEEAERGSGSSFSGCKKLRLSQNKF